jgi:large subunit ribosomal protein L20
MPRVTRGTRGARKRKRILKQAKGYVGGRKRLYRTAKEAVERALQYAYRDRRRKKRDFRRLWIRRINAAARLNNISYSQFMAGLKKANIGLDRKILADLAVTEPARFSELVSIARTHLNGIH